MQTTLIASINYEPVGTVVICERTNEPPMLAEVNNYGLDKPETILVYNFPASGLISNVRTSHRQAVQIRDADRTVGRWLVKPKSRRRRASEAFVKFFLWAIKNC